MINKNIKRNYAKHGFKLVNVIMVVNVNLLMENKNCNSIRLPIMHYTKLKLAKPTLSNVTADMA